VRKGTNGTELEVVKVFVKAMSVHRHWERPVI